MVVERPSLSGGHQERARSRRCGAARFARQASTGMSQAYSHASRSRPEGFRTPKERDRDVSQRDLHHF